EGCALSRWPSSLLDNHLRYRLAPVAVTRRGDGASLENVDRTRCQVGDRYRELCVGNRLAAPGGGIGGTRSDTRPAEFIAGCAPELDERQHYCTADRSERDLA